MAHDRKKITNNLRKYRILMGFRQSDVAERLGIKNNTLISRWERGVTMPSAENLLKLSKLYKTLVDQLYYDLGKEFEKELFPNDKSP